MSMSEIFRPVGELDEADGVVIDRRHPHWQAAVADAVERACDDGDTTYLVEDGKRVAVISPVTTE